ncbi:MAG TPA: cell division protein SepF [Mycobacteriales bacterium]|nr:cell division protein SepF [Mycobacteriales bacterium]
MAGMLRKTALYLGLVDDDEEYEDDYVDEDDYARPRRDSRPAREPATRAPVRAERVPVRAAPRSHEDVDVRRVGAPAAEAYRITTLQPRTYNEARTIGEHFREGVPVIINLTEMDDADAKRLVDFCAGLIFGLHGSIERVTNKVFLLSPSNVEVSEADKARIVEGGFFNQS